VTRTVVSRSVSAAVAAILLAAGAVVCGAPAHADQDKDDNFIAFLDKNDVPYESRTEAIRMAKQFCLDSTRQGSDPLGVAGYKLAFENGWAETEAAKVVEGAVYTYCPRVWGLE